MDRAARHDGAGSTDVCEGRVGDFVAVPKGELARVFEGVEERPEISIAPLWPHSVLDYLRHPSVTETILSAP